MADQVHVRVVPVAGVEQEQLDRVLDEMERITGLRGEPDGDGRLYVAEGTDTNVLNNRIIEGLPSGWQSTLQFEL